MIKRKIISALLIVSVGSAMLSAMPVNAEGFSIKGDVNADGVFDIADAVQLQKWLLAVPDTHLKTGRQPIFAKTTGSMCLICV